MTETPGSPWSDTETAATFPFAGDWRAAGEVNHTFTHFHLTLTVWSVTADTPLDEGWWAEETMLDREALPSLFRKVLKTSGLE